MSIKNSARELLEKEVGPATFGSFLRVARTSLGLSQTEMGDLLDVSRSVICDIEKGRQLVSPKLANKIALKAGLSTILAVKLCLQDQLKAAHLKLKVELEVA